MTTVILGTAHGIDVPGKQSPDGRLREYRYSRETCRAIRDILIARGIPCIIDIDDEHETSLRARINAVNRIVARHGDCIYISIHNNAAASDGKWHPARGFGVFVAPNASARSLRLASIVHRNALEAGMGGNRCYPRTGYYIQSLAVCRDTHCPAILTENLFQDNLDDVQFLLSDRGRAAIVNLHVQSIIQYLNP